MSHKIMLITDKGDRGAQEASHHAVWIMGNDSSWFKRSFYFVLSELLPPPGHTVMAVMLYKLMLFLSAQYIWIYYFTSEQSVQILSIKRLKCGSWGQAWLSIEWLVNLTFTQAHWHSIPRMHAGPDLITSGYLGPGWAERPGPCGPDTSCTLLQFQATWYSFRVYFCPQSASMYFSIFRKKRI